MSISSYLNELQNVKYKIYKITNRDELKKIMSRYEDSSPRFISNSAYHNYVAKTNDDVIGLIVVYSKYPKKLNDNFYKKLGYEIDLTISFLYVEKKHQNSGIGTSLIRHVLGIYKGKRIGLTTNKGFTTNQAYHLYKKLGFEMIKDRGRTQFWYKENK